MKRLLKLRINGVVKFQIEIESIKQAIFLVDNILLNSKDENNEFSFAYIALEKFGQALAKDIFIYKDVVFFYNLFEKDGRFLQPKQKRFTELLNEFKEYTGIFCTAGAFKKKLIEIAKSYGFETTFKNKVVDNKGKTHITKFVVFTDHKK